MLRLLFSPLFSLRGTNLAQNDANHSTSFIVKAFVTTLALALCAAVPATAQSWSAAPAVAPDTVLLLETTEGNYLVRRFMVKSSDDAGYSVRYQINLAKLSAMLGGNSKQLNELHAFMEKVMKDSLMRVRSVMITGYASPDGTWKLNEALAKNRATDFKNYVDKKYGFSKKYDVKTAAMAESWEACRPSVVEWPVPDKQAVLNILDGNWTEAQKQAALEKLPAAWEYMKKNILPPLRRVEMTINYGEKNVYELRTMIRKPKSPQPAVVECPCDCGVIDDSVTGILVEMDSPGADFKKDVREVGKMTKAEMKAAKKVAREAEKMAKKAAKAAEKIAKAEAKAAKKAAKAVDKM